MAHDREFPYTLSEWRRDLRRWQAATKVPGHRQGPSVSLAVGGAARTVLDEVDEETLIHGVLADFRDGQGEIQHTGIAALLRVLELKFPANNEALMLQAGLEFFSFCPRAGEHWQVLFLRFDTMLQRADALAELQISYPFRSWMLFSVLRLPTRKWADLLKELQHHFPRNEQEYKELQAMILREKALETQVHNLSITDRRGGGPREGGNSSYFTGDDDCMPLYL